jgi:hypothetical protein
MREMRGMRRMRKMGRMREKIKLYTSYLLPPASCLLPHYEC